MQVTTGSFNEQGRHFDEHELVFMMGEELKKPLTAIKALSEAQYSSNDTHHSILLETRKALRTIDNILLYQKLQADQLSLNFGPVHIGSTLTHVAHDLQPLSLARGCETEIYIQSGTSSIHAHSGALQSALESLWQAVLGMTHRPSAMTWHVYRTKQGVRVALTNSSLDLDRVLLTHADKAGQSRQPYTGIAGPATDLVIANNFFSLLGGRLRKTTRDGKPGFGVTLPMSQQMTIVYS